MKMKKLKRINSYRNRFVRKSALLCGDNCGDDDDGAARCKCERYAYYSIIRDGDATYQWNFNLLNNWNGKTYQKSFPCAFAYDL
jgi:hypothetical protein